MASVPEGMENRNHVLGSIDSGKAIITITPADPKLQYALLEGNNTVEPGWQDVQDGQVVFSGLDSFKTYKIVVIEKAELPSPSPADLAHIGIDVTVIPKASFPAKNIRATSSKILIYKTDSTLKYAVIDAETGAVVTVAGGTEGWQSGTGGTLTFSPLESGKPYEVVTLPNSLPDGVLEENLLLRPGTAVITGFDSINGAITDTQSPSVTVKPTDVNRTYAVVDENGIIVGEWKNGSAGGVTFDGLTPGEGYKIISTPKGTNPGDNPLSALPGVPFVAPAGPRVRPEATVTISQADPEMEYALIGADGNVIGNTWRSGEKEGDSILFPGLDVGTPYQVVVRPKSGGENSSTERPYITTATQVFTPFTGAEGSVTEGSASITVRPAASDGYYAAVDASGNVVDGWKRASDGTVTWGGLVPGTSYKIVYVNDGSDNAPIKIDGYQNTPGYTVTTPPAPVAENSVTKTDNSITKTDNSITIAPSETGYEYRLVDKATGLPIPGEWKAGNGGSLVFTSVLPGKEYEVIRRKTDGGAGISLPSAGTSVTTTGSSGTKYTVTHG